MINVKLIRTVWSFTNTISYISVEISNTSVEISLLKKVHADLIL